MIYFTKEEKTLKAKYIYTEWGHIINKFPCDLFPCATVTYNELILLYMLLRIIGWKLRILNYSNLEYLLDTPQYQLYIGIR